MSWSLANDEELAYEWVGGLDLCVALVRGDDVGDLLMRSSSQVEMGPLPLAEVQSWYDDEVEYDGSASIIAAKPFGGWTLLLERGGYQTNQRENLMRLSIGTVAVCCYRGGNGHSSFGLAVDGQMKREFDPLTYDGCGWNDYTGQPLVEERGLHFGEVGLSSAAGWALLSRISGIRLTLEDLEDGFAVAIGVAPL